MKKLILYVAIFAVILLGIVGSIVIAWVSSVVRLEHFASLATIIAATAAVGALITALVEYFSRMKKQREDSRPYVVVALQPSKASFSLFDVVIENIGKSAAKDISIKFSPNQKLSGTSKKINDIKIMKNLRFMPPGNRLNFYFGSALAGEPEENSIRKTYKVKVGYADVNGVAYLEEFVCDPTDYEGMSILEIKTMHNLVKSVDKLVEQTKKTADAQKRYTDSIVEEGIRIRNGHAFSTSPYTYLNIVVAIVKSPSENEFWLKPFVYDYVLLLKQARDAIAAKRTKSDTDNLIIEDLNKIISIKQRLWAHKKEDIDKYLADLVEHHSKLADIQ